MSRQNLKKNSQSALLAEPRGGAVSKEQIGELIDELILVPEHVKDDVFAAAEVPSCRQVKRRRQKQGKSKEKAGGKTKAKVKTTPPAQHLASSKAQSGKLQQLDPLMDWSSDLPDTVVLTEHQPKLQRYSRKSRFYGAFLDYSMPFLLDMPSESELQLIVSKQAQEKHSNVTQLSLLMAVPVIKPVSRTTEKLGGQELQPEVPAQELAQAPLSVELAMSVEDAAQQDSRDPFALGPKLELKSMKGWDLVDNEILYDDDAWLVFANNNTELPSMACAALVANKLPDSDQLKVKAPRKKRSSAKAQAMEAMPMLLDFDDEEFKDSDKILKPQSQSAYQKQQAAKMAQAKFLAELQAAQDATKEVYNPLQYCNQLLSDNDFNDAKAEDVGNDDKAVESGELLGTLSKALLSKSNEDCPRLTQDNVKLIKMLSRELVYSFTERHFYTKMPKPVFGLTLMVVLVALDTDGGCWVGKPDLQSGAQLKAWQQWQINDCSLHLKLLEKAPAGQLTNLVSDLEAMQESDPSQKAELEETKADVPELVPVSAQSVTAQVVALEQLQMVKRGSFPQPECKSSVQRQAQNYAGFDAALEQLSSSRITSELASAFKNAQNSLQELKFTLQFGQATSFLSLHEISSPEQVLAEPIAFQQDNESTILEPHANASVIGNNFAEKINLDNDVYDLADPTENLLASQEDLLNWVKRSVRHQCEICKMDLENLLKMQIAASILEDISRDDFVELLSEVFMVNGYTTLVCERNDTVLPEIDLLLSSGKLGFGGSKVCVKLSYNTAPLCRMVLDEFNGLVKKYQAEYGILISPSGFKKSFPPEICREFFKLQCWDMQRVVNEILACYPKLSSTAQKLLPLQQIWIVDD